MIKTTHPGEIGNPSKKFRLDILTEIGDILVTPKFLQNVLGDLRL